MTTILPVPVAGWGGNHQFFCTSGIGYIFDGDGNASTPYYSSSDLVSWTGFGAYPSNLRVDLGGATIWVMAKLSGNYIVIGDDGMGSYWMAKSLDGINWTQTDISADPFPPVLFWAHSSAEKDGVLYILSYAGANAWMTTVTTGLHISASTITNLPTSSQYSILQDSGLLYAFPISKVSGKYVMTSTDGITWSPTGSALDAISNHAGFGVHAGKLYCCGGRLSTPSTLTNKVYSTTDFVTWALEGYTTTWSSREFPAVASFGDSLVVAGGWQGTQEIWKAVAQLAPIGRPL